MLSIDDETLRESTACVERVGALAPEKLAPGDAAAAAWAVAHCDGPITRAGKDAVFSGQASTPELERAPARPRRAAYTRFCRRRRCFPPPTACCSRFSFASARTRNPRRRVAAPGLPRPRVSHPSFRRTVAARCAGGGGNYRVVSLHSPGRLAEARRNSRGVPTTGPPLGGSRRAANETRFDAEFHGARVAGFCATAVRAARREPGLQGRASSTQVSSQAPLAAGTAVGRQRPSIPPTAAQRVTPRRRRDGRGTTAPVTRRRRATPTAGRQAAMAPKKRKSAAKTKTATKKKAASPKQPKKAASPKKKKGGALDFDVYADADEGVVTFEGLAQLADDLGIDPSSDTKLLAMCWRLGAEKPGCLSKEEWARFAENRHLPTYGKAQTVRVLKAGWNSLDPNFLDNGEFKPFFRFCFEFNREGTKRFLERDTALALLPLCGRGQIAAHAALPRVPGDEAPGLQAQ